MYPIYLDCPQKRIELEIIRKNLENSSSTGFLLSQSMYCSKQDIQACMKKVQCLHYDEERSIYDRVCIKPCSSGFDLGSSNWVIRGTRCLSYFSASDLISGHAMGLNVASHISSDVLLFCDLESSSEEKKKMPKTVVDSDKGGEISEIRMCTIPEHCDELSSVGKATVDAVESGGSVLIATSGFGASFELLEVISQALSASKLE
jgi:predicted metal-dependent RNase